MRRCLLPFALFVPLSLIVAGAIAQSTSSKPSPTGIAPVIACTDLNTADLASAVGAPVRITGASEVDATPAPYCRVTATIDPAIRIEVRLPLKTWTQRYLQTGCGGLCGNLNINVNAGQAQGCAPVTSGEIALASTDMGHANAGGRGGNGDPVWAEQNPQTTIDFAYRAQHVTALAAKALIKRFYGHDPAYSYFNGCSDGGREALMEAQRYPGDFNAIAAGAPAMNFITQNTFYHGWNAHVNTGANGQAILAAAQLPILHRAALTACDERDGAKDGLISKPWNCAFDPAVTLCKPNQAASECLTAAQVNVAKEIYRGAHDSAGHKFVISGPLPGSELNWQGVYVPNAPGQPLFSANIALGTIRYLAYGKTLAPSFTIGDFAFTAANFNDIKSKHALYDSTDPDLTKFLAHGGKLLLWHGLADPHISPLNSIAYYGALRKTMGEAKVKGFARLYLFPGGGHCNTGSFTFPLLSMLMNWAEDGIAPETVGPIEPYPSVAEVPASQLEWMGSSFYASVR
ncbi:MAG TPA: tannase/feruloyl esterase family alpha/beta hydrolase [Bryobacteraceae bacterium]|nr:tannase/feruloyl esterase family alpha/beta hydrolase [Bryobacteraceae bacterium]